MAPAGTGTVIWVLELTTKPGAAVPLKATAVVPVKLLPVMTTLVPASPLPGVKLSMTSGGCGVKLPVVKVWNPPMPGTKVPSSTVLRYTRTPWLAGPELRWASCSRTL